MKRKNWNIGAYNAIPCAVCQIPHYCSKNSYTNCSTFQKDFFKKNNHGPLIYSPLEKLKKRRF